MAQVEMGVLMGWLESAYSAEVAARFQLDVPTFNVATVCLSLGAADECGAPSPAALLGLGIPASPPGAAAFNQMSRGMYGAPPPLVAPMANLTTATATTRSPHLAADGAAHGMWRQARLQF